MTEFWKTKSLSEMDQKEWESLCDGCAQCCLIKLEDEDTGELYYTDVVCHLLDQKHCRCGDYEQRCALVPTCIKLTHENVNDLSWMPSDCAYRRIAEGRELAWWHPLVSGSAESVNEAGVSVKNKVVSESNVKEDELEDHIIDWAS